MDIKIVMTDPEPGQPTNTIVQCRWMVVQTHHLSNRSALFHCRPLRSGYCSLGWQFPQKSLSDI